MVIGVLVGTQCFGQDSINPYRRHSFEIELLGAGAVNSLNYNRVYYSNSQWQLHIRFGMGLWLQRVRPKVIIPTTLGTGITRWHGRWSTSLSLGGTIYITSPATYEDTCTFCTSRYNRYMWLGLSETVEFKHRWFLRLTVYGITNFNNALPWGGVSFGLKIF